MPSKQPGQDEVLMIIHATPNEIIALNHVLQAFLSFHESEPQKRKGTVQIEVVPLIHRFYHRIGSKVGQAE